MTVMVAGPKSLAQLQAGAIEYIDEQAKRPAAQLGPNSTAAQVVNAVLKRLIAIKPAHRQAFSQPGAVAEWKKSWTLAFAQHGIRTLAQIEQGIRRAEQDTSPYMPSCGQFIEWCSQAELSELDVLDAFTRMIDRKAPLTDVEHAARLKCAYACRNQLPQDKALTLFGASMRSFAARQARGERIPSRDTLLLEYRGEPRRFNQAFEQQIRERVPSTELELRLLKVRQAARRRAAFLQRKARSRIRVFTGVNTGGGA